MDASDVQHNLDMHEDYGHNNIKTDVRHLTQLIELHAGRINNHQAHLEHMAELLESLTKEIMELRQMYKHLRDYKLDALG
jgi:archaellum component FlaC